MDFEVDVVDGSLIATELLAAAKPASAARLIEKFKATLKSSGDKF